ncbi:asparagine synthase-related protein [Natronorubrum daqingense]|uniref:Asparagine synthase n=1 Tax=Natronorubrum daqingense TaxID=588898 RepID=A0A1N7C7W3_9EURY|nr:asparagine synthase-related protein [Natronorubrum daqingense]APX96782.1 asparagine synthase [Natronorubrum daqingense]SIR59672.1 asparagine synthase (glutamine-hydrolysing) [Natronorubrum daqingense]
MQTRLCGDGWTHEDGISVRGRAFAEESLLEGEALARRFHDAVDRADPDNSLESISEAVADAAVTLEGFYAAVVRTPDVTILVADGARSIPLYYDASGTIVSDRGTVVRDSIEAERDPVAENEFLLTRYVTGPETVWQSVFAIQPGEVVRLEDGNVTRGTYREYWPAGPSVGSGAEDPESRLEAALETALDRLERVAGDRPVVLPLSGGYDSRLLASSLVARGREVIGFTFGRSGHPDVEMSRAVASRLGIQWEFLPYDEETWREWYHASSGVRYRERAFGGDALPFLAEWPALRELLERGRIPQDALYCPGHTVATPSERLPVFTGESSRGRSGRSGGCVPATDGADDESESKPDSEPESRIEASLEALVEYVLETHYGLWEWDDDAFREAALERIRRGVLGGRQPEQLTDPTRLAAGYERWEWRGRMSTFTNGDLRAYEDAGVDWWLPLWDPAYVRAWEQVPLEQRREKAAHASLAVEAYRNAANVSKRRARRTDRSLSPFDRCLSLLRHTPVRQFSERDGDWLPPFLAPRSSWSEPGQHPLAWYGAVDDEVLERVPDSRGFYALRTAAKTGRLRLSKLTESVPENGRIELSTE